VRGGIQKKTIRELHQGREHVELRSPDQSYAEEKQTIVPSQREVFIACPGKPRKELRRKIRGIQHSCIGGERKIEMAERWA